MTLKKGIIVLLILIALILGSPWLLGVIAEHRMHVMVSTFNQKLKSSGLSVTLQDYKRSWFSATARVALVMPNENSVKGLTVFYEDYQLTHGPIVFHENGRFVRFGIAKVLSQSWVGDLPAHIKAVLNLTKPISRSHGMLDFKRHFRGYAATQPFSFILKDFIFKWGGVKGDFDFSTSDDFYHVNLLSSPMLLQKGRTELPIGQTRFADTLEKTNYNNLWAEDLRLHADNMAMQVTPIDLEKLVPPSILEILPEKFNIKALALDFVNEVKDSRYNGLVSLGAEKIQLFEAYGPMRFSLSATGLDPFIVGQLTSKVTDSAHAQTSKQFLDLLDAGARLSVDHFDLDTPLGKVEAKASVEVMNKPSALDFILVMSVLRIDVDVKVPLLFLHQIIDTMPGANDMIKDDDQDRMLPQRSIMYNHLAWLVKEGYIVKTDKYYTFSFHSEGFHVNLNNKELSAASLLSTPTIV